MKVKENDDRVEMKYSHQSGMSVTLCIAINNKAQENLHDKTGCDKQ